MTTLALRRRRRERDDDEADRGDGESLSLLDAGFGAAADDGQDRGRGSQDD